MSVRMKAIVGHTYMGRDIKPGEEFDCLDGDVGYVQGTFGLGYPVDDVGKVTAALGYFTATNPATAKANEEDAGKLQTGDAVQLMVVAGDSAAIDGKAATVGTIDAGVITLDGLDLSGESASSLDGVGAIAAVQPPPPAAVVVTITAVTAENPTHATASEGDVSKLQAGDMLAIAQTAGDTLAALDGATTGFAIVNTTTIALSAVDLTGATVAGVTATGTVQD